MILNVSRFFPTQYRPRSVSCASVSRLRTRVRVDAIGKPGVPALSSAQAVGPDAGLSDQELFDSVVTRYPDWVGRMEFLILPRPEGAGVKA